MVIRQNLLIYIIIKKHSVKTLSQSNLKKKVYFIIPKYISSIKYSSEVNQTKLAWSFLLIYKTYTLNYCNTMFQGASEMLVMLGAHNVREASEEGRMEVHFFP